MLAPIRRPGRRERGGDTVVIHGSCQTTPPLLVKSANGGEIDESEEDDICYDINGTDEGDEKKEESDRIADTPVPPRFTKAVTWT